MASSFFQLGYHPTNSPTLDVSGNLGISLQGFNALGRDLGKFGTTLAKTDQDNADRILAERMNQYKTEADLMNAIQSGKLYDGISGRVSAAVSQQALQDRFKMLEKDEERRKYENNLQFDQLGDYRSKIFAAAQMGNAALAGKLLQEAAIKKGATGSVVNMLKEDANPSRNALTAAGHLGLARQQYEDNRQNLEQIADLRERLRLAMREADTPQKQQEAHDIVNKFGHDKGYSNLALNDLNDYYASIVGGKGAFGDDRILPSADLKYDPTPYGYYLNKSVDAKGNTVTSLGNIDSTTGIMDTSATLQAERLSSITGGLNSDNFIKNLNKYNQFNSNSSAIDSFNKERGFTDEKFKRNVNDTIQAIRKKYGVTVPQALALLEDKYEISTEWAGISDTPKTIEFDKNAIKYVKGLNTDPERETLFTAIRKTKADLENNRELAKQVANDLKFEQKRFDDEYKEYQRRPTRAKEAKLLEIWQRIQKKSDNLSIYSNEFNKAEEKLKQQFSTYQKRNPKEFSSLRATKLLEETANPTSF